jgi:hypothetical protein
MKPQWPNACPHCMYLCSDERNDMYICTEKKNHRSRGTKGDRVFVRQYGRSRDDHGWATVGEIGSFSVAISHWPVYITAWHEALHLGFVSKTEIDEALNT